MKLAVALIFLALNFYVYQFMARSAVIPARESFEHFPMTLGEWRCAEKFSLTPEILKNLGATDYLICDYARPGTPELVSLYVGYHETQVREEGGGGLGENSIHPPAHCLPGSGWDIIDSRTVALDLPGLPGESPGAKRLIIAKGDLRQLVYYWYQSRGRIITEDWKKIVYVGFDRATRGRTDGALVRFTVPVFRNDDEQAEAAFREVAEQTASLLPRYVPE